jgi:uncharacterized protein
MIGESSIMMGLGDYRFSLRTAAYQELRRRNSWRWPMVDRVGARPAAQFVGPGEDSVTMSGVVYPHFNGGLGQLSAMRAEADKGEPLMLVDGTGQVWGKYVITDLEEGQEVFFSNGAPRCQHFDLSLQAYGGEDGNSLADAASGSVTVPTLPTQSLDSTISNFSGADPLGFAQTVASKAMMGLPNVRTLVGMTTAGVDSLASSIATVGTVFGSSSGATEAMQRAATAVPAALNSLLSPSGVSTLSSFGIDLNGVVSTANGLGDVPLDSVLDAVNVVGVGSVAPQLFTDADQLAAFTALAEVRGDVQSI